MSGSNVSSQLLELGCIGAEEFKTAFYLTYDCARDSLMSFYREGSTFAWNGIVWNSMMDIRNFYKSLPPTKHEILSIDAHPVCPANVDLSTSAILITICGLVQYGLSDPECFNETFIIEREGDSQNAPYFVRSHIRRDGFAKQPSS